MDTPAADIRPDTPLAAFNALPGVRAREQLLACCAAPGWAAAMLAARPYAGVPGAQAASDAAVAAMTDADLDAALAGHPRIGARPAPAHPGWSATEQAGALASGEDTLAALARGNAVYEQRFGHIYLVCASGRSGAELLTLLRSRLGNDPQVERQVVRTELAAINRLRLARLLGGQP